MTTVLLVRHATCAPVGTRLAGRAAGVSLNADGRAQAAGLAAWLAPVALDAVYSSPLERARETATYLTGTRGLAVVPHEAFTEIDFGAWTGHEIAALAPDSHWQRFNSFRSGTRAPGGELMLEAQARAVAALLDLATHHRDQVVAVVSHADVIKAAVAFFVGAPLDLVLRLEITPASVSALALHDWDAQLLSLNGGPSPRV